MTDLMWNAASTQVEWNSECKRVFKDLKTVMQCPCSSNSQHWDPLHPGGVLSQIDASGGEHPVAYYSRKLAPKEKNYATIEKECLSIKAANQSIVWGPRSLW